MKRCPNCQRTYPDDAPGFCVNDGTQLVTEEAPAYDPQKTILASPPPPPAAPPPQYNPAPPQAPPPPAYQQPNEAAGIKPPTGWQPQPPPQAQPPAAAPWPPPPPQQQGGQWGGGYYQQPGQQPYGAPYAPAGGSSKSLSLVTIIVGGVSGLLGLLLLADYLGWAHIFDRDTGYATIIGAVVTGAAALVTGIIALISKRQTSKALAIVGMLLAAFSIGLWIYFEVEYGVLFG
ncbi:MAG TPA: DUF4190 domain-containing protein [Pyrinomonadaceae bacterium]|nr:DUF4190 domain-containing protein [Pyrinomonadaceae bacterium]